MPTIISICIAGEIAYLAIRGRIVAGAEVAAVRDAVVRAGPHFGLMIVNLHDVVKVDAAGLSALVFAYSTARSVGARFRLAAVPPRLVEVLEITRLDTILCRQTAGIEKGLL